MPLNWVICTQILVEKLITVPVFVYWVLRLITYQLIIENINGLISNCFGVLFGFAATLFVFLAFNVFIIKDTMEMSKREAINKYLIDEGDTLSGESSNYRRNA